MILQSLFRRRRPAIAALLIAVSLVIVLPVIAAAPKKGGLYVGKTSKQILPPEIPQGIQGTVRIYVSPSGKKIVGPSHVDTLMARCSNGHVGVRGFLDPRAKIKNGKFSFEDTKGQDTGTMTGRFEKGGKVSGTVTYKSTLGCEPDGPITYTAKLSAKKGTSKPGR